MRGEDQGRITRVARRDAAAVTTQPAADATRREVLRAFAAGAAVLGGALAGGCGPIETVRAPREGYGAAERKVIGAVLVARRAGIIFHHLGPALRPFASDAVITYARDREPDPHDVPFNYDQLLDRWIQEMHASPPQGTTLQAQDVQATVFGGTAKLVCTLRTMSATRTWVQREEYKLVLRDGAWLIAEARWIPLEAEVGRYAYRFSRFEWRRRDAAVKEAREMGDSRSLVGALRDAHRWPEAHDELTLWSQRATKDMAAKDAAAIWRLRGIVAVEAGRARDALPSFKMALKLDPEIQLPMLKAADDARVG